MATVEEVLAKADAWEKAGNPENAAKLRSYAATLQPAAPKHDRAAVESKAAEWEKAGQPDKAEKLRAFAATLAPTSSAVPSDILSVSADDAPQAPPRALSPQEERQKSIDDYGLFTMANPDLAKLYKPGDKLPAPGEAVMAGGGAAKSGPMPTTVKPWRDADVRKASRDTFGDTAKAMVVAPMEGARAFGAGIMDSSVSPSREFLANDPLTKNLPSWMLTGMGKVADVGGAGLSVVGAGLAGATGLGAEFVPGQNAADERKLAEETLAMSMFAVPELAGASSVPARMAAVAESVPKVVGDVAAAERVGIPVMRSDIRPPQTAIGKIAQRVGEGIPIAGTGGMRAKQFAARADAVKDFVQTYVGDAILAATDTVAESVRRVHGKAVEKLAAQKNEVIKGASTGVVPVPRAVAAIDAQIAKLKAAKNEGFTPIITELENFKKSITDQALPEIDMNRAYIGKVFSGLDADKIRDAGEKALSAIYGPLKADMAGFIRSVGGDGAVAKWNSANEGLSKLATDVERTALRDVLRKGETTPEVVKKMLFSQKPSDLKLLYRSLDEDGRKAARTAIVQEAVAKSGGAEGLSVERFKNTMERLGSQFGEFFKGEDGEAAKGLARALKLTEQAARAGAAPLTGAQNLPTMLTLMISSFTGGSVAGTSAVLGTIGGLARIYEAVGVKSALRRLSKASTPAAERFWLQKLEGAIRETGLPATAQQQSAMPMAVGQN